MGIKNAGKAKISKNPGKAPTKETVDTPISECEAENPLNCRFHGLQALEQQLSALLPAMGYKVPFGTDKLQGGKGFEIRIDGKFDVNQGEFKQSLTNAFKQQGWDLTYNGKVEGAGHSFYLKKGNGEVDAETPSSSDKADMVDSSKPPKDDEASGEGYGDEDFNALLEEAESEEPTKSEDLDLMEFIGNPDKLKESDMSDFDALLEEDMGDFDELLAEEAEEEASESATLESQSGNIVDVDAMKSIVDNALDSLPGYTYVSSETTDYGAVKLTLEKKPDDYESLTHSQIKEKLDELLAPQGYTTGGLVGGKKGKDVLFVTPISSSEKAVDEKSSKKWMDGSNKESTNTDWNTIGKLVQGALDGLPGYTLAEVVGSDNGKLEVVMQPKPDDDESLTHEQIVSKITPFLKTLGVTVGPLHKKNGNVVFGIQELDGGAVSSPESKLPNPEPVSKQEQTTPSEESPEIMGGLDEALMKPLVHNDDAFPSHLSQKMLEDAIYNGLSAGGNGGLQTTIIEIDGKKFVCKKGVGKKSNIIKNGFNADMAYRAGGVYAPDAKLYEYGDGVTYKLSEYIEGNRLIDIWKTADEAKRDSIRKELLKGFPLDALFSNYDVLGTSPEESQTVTITGANGKPQKTHVAFDNIIIGNDGHAYRIDNDGAFAMTGTGGHKSSSGGSYTVPVEAEHWDNWDERQWIDDFRTMRRNEKNLGMFDRYTTADIFLAAGNINLDKAVASLPKPLQGALAKPLFEMKQMTYRAVNIALGGYKNNGFVSMALDASYEASKKGLREQCQLAVAWNNPGFGKYKEHWGNYQPQPFGEKPPEPPEDPRAVLSSKLKNEDYTGSKIGQIIFSAAKTINYHGGEKKFDENGKPIGKPMEKPDYDPNASKIADWEKIDREKLAELAKTDENAKTLLGLYDTIAYSKENGWKKPIGLVPQGLEIKGKLDANFKSSTEKKILEDMAGAIEEFKAKEKQYHKDLKEYENRKSAHKKKEEEKALAAGGSPYHNFHHFAQALMEEGINTDGIAHKVQTNGIKPIESSMHSQKGSSYNEDAVKWKVREMMALGYSPQQILDMAEDEKLYNGSYYIGCINSSLLPNKESWDRDMNSQAMYLGLNMLKMENEHNDLYDKQSGVVFLNRNIGNTPMGISTAEQAIYDSSTKTGWIGPHIDSAADCMQFEDNSWHKPKKQVYAVPLSRIVCCANNETQNGVHQDYGYGENEYVGNLYQLPCWVYHEQNHLTWKNAIDQAKKSEGMTALLKKFATRLAAFNTLG